MKRILVALAACLILFSSCVFDFGGDDNDGGNDPSAEPQAYDIDLVSLSVQVRRHYSAADVFLGSEVWFIKSGTESGSRLVEQIQYYDAEDSLTSTTAFAYTDDTASAKFTTVSRYDAANTLQSVESYAYDGDGEIESVSTYQYDGDSGDCLLTGTRMVSSPGFVSAAGSMRVVSVYSVPDSGTAGTSLALSGAAARYFLPASTGDDDWNLEVSWAGTGFEPPSTGNVCAGASVLDSVQHPDRIVLSSLPDLAGTVPDAPNQEELWTSGLAITGSRASYADGYGDSEIAFDSDWAPVSLVRSDERLEKAVSIQLVRDGSGRITAKKTYYGTTLALELDVTYDGDGYPLTVSATGAAMMLPLSFAVTYGSGSGYDHSITWITVSVSDIPMYRLSFAYNNELGAIPLTLKDAASFDPFSFAESLLASSVEISCYEIGETSDDLYATFTFAPVTGGVRATVTDDKDAMTGFYEILYSGGLAGSLAAYDADSKQVWYKEFGYGASFFNDLYDSIELPSVSSADIDRVTALGSHLGQLYETWVPGDVQERIEAGATDAVASGTEYLDSISQDNVIVDLLFDFLF